MGARYLSPPHGKRLLDFSLLFGGPATSIEEARGFASPPHNEFAFLAEHLLGREILRLSLLLDHSIIRDSSRSIEESQGLLKDPGDKKDAGRTTEHSLHRPFCAQLPFRALPK